MQENDKSQYFAITKCKLLYYSITKLALIFRLLTTQGSDLSFFGQEHSYNNEQNTICRETH